MRLPKKGRLGKNEGDGVFEWGVNTPMHTMSLKKTKITRQNCHLLTKRKIDKHILTHT